MKISINAQKKPIVELSTLTTTASWDRIATLKRKYWMFIYNKFHYTENDPKSDPQCFTNINNSDRITIPNLLLAAGKESREYRIHSWLQKATNGRRAKD